MFPNTTIQTGDIVLESVKVLFLIAFFLYMVFAFIAVRQIEIMRKTVVTSLSPFIQILGYLHLLISIMVLMFAFANL